MALAYKKSQTVECLQRETDARKAEEYRLRLWYRDVKRNAGMEPGARKAALCVIGTALRKAQQRYNEAYNIEQETWSAEVREHGTSHAAQRKELLEQYLLDKRGKRR